MKQLTGSLVLLCACLTLTAGEADLKRRVQEQAQAMADAFRKGDVEKFVGYLNPKLFKLAGGRDKLVAKMKAFLEEMKGKGLALKSYKTEIPDAILGQGQERFAVVPYTLVMTLSGKRITQRAALVAASADGGKRWTFLDAQGKTPENVRALLPNLPKEVKLPAPQAPVIEDAP
jgi:hypothetical protein